MHMGITTIDIHKEKKTIKKLLSLLESDPEIILTEGDAPIARLVAIGRRVPGLHAGAIWASLDFDEPLPGDLWVGTA
jgi:antitoxin (DNA-binding transcriptional repressor) of toxin-antitoxin stability system